ncbi:MAG: type II toxin-antitoxin system VapC family toxin, partial [Acidobacteriota bacterium]
MTLDSSALVAILFAEPGYLDVVDRILDADEVRVGAPTLTETSLVFIGRRGAKSAESVEGLIEELGVSVVPFGAAEWQIAVDAFRRFGRGRHAAALN